MVTEVRNTRGTLVDWRGNAVGTRVDEKEDKWSRR